MEYNAIAKKNKVILLKKKILLRHTKNWGSGGVAKQQIQCNDT